MNTKTNPIICVDFDGVIHSYASGWKGADIIPDPPVPGAIDWVMEHLPCPEPISAMAPEYIGPEVVIYSARSSQKGGIKAMQQWFIANGLHPSYISEGILKFPETKPPAFLTIDDRAICFTGRFPTNEEMMGFQTWQKKDVAGAPIQTVVEPMIPCSHDDITIDSHGTGTCNACKNQVVYSPDQRRWVAMGATGKFPDGKMNPEDEGELQLGVAHDQDNVIINFEKPVAWLGLPRKEALQFAQMIANHAMQLRE